MSVDIEPVVDQVCGGVNVIMQSIRDKISDQFLNPCAYINTSIKNLYMVIGKMQINEPGLLAYFTIGFQTPKHKHVTDVMEVAYTTTGIFYRFGGVSIHTVNMDTNESMSTQEQVNWIKIIVQSNAELLTVLKANEELNNGNKKNSK